MEDEACTLLLLASGLSTRFTGDKLMSELAGVPLLQHSANLYRNRYNVDRFSVVATNQIERIHVLTKMEWEILLNPLPELGMSHSIRLGLDQAKRGRTNTLLIVLADMPKIKDRHLDQLCHMIDNGARVAFSKSKSILSPPVAFHRETWNRLESLQGDTGAKQVLDDFSEVETLDMSDNDLQDVNTIEDLTRMREFE